MPPSDSTEAAGATLLSAALETMPYGFSVWDDDLRLVLWNDRYVALYGFPAERLTVGMTLGEICTLTIAVGNHPDRTADDLFELYRERHFEHADPNNPGTYEKHIGERIIRTTYQRRSGGGWVITHEDVTESTQRLKALRDRETELAREKLRLEVAVNTMGQGLCMFDADQRLVICNRQYAQHYRLPEALLRPGTSLRTLLEYRLEHGVFAAGERDQYVEKRIAIAREGKQNSHEVEFDDGRVLRISHYPMPGGGWVATQEDITGSVRQMRRLEEREAALAKQNMRFEAAVNNMNQGLCMFDKDHQLVICNANYARIYELPPDFVKPGTTLEAILEYRIGHGFEPVGGVAAYLHRRQELIANAKTDADVIELKNGKVISVVHQPMPDGGWVATHQDITEQRRTEAQIRHLARHDSLTDLPNRHQFREIMANAGRRIERGEIFAVLAIDLDHFKLVNDSLGHATGDAVLKDVARRLRDCCRGEDVVARLGGDEFALLTGALDDASGAGHVAARIVKRMGEPFEADGHHIMIGASVGIAMAPSDGNETDGLMRAADMALYHGKTEGRGGYHFFERGMNDALQERREVEIMLRRAVIDKEFRLVFQPLLNLTTGRVCAVEALLRWDHPERGSIPPNEFIPIAEESGLIVAIGEWVLNEACAAAARWPDDIHVAVNLSTVQFRSRNLLDHVKSALATSGLDPARLEVEVTESLLLDDSDATLGVLHELRRLGVRISMDDFGTGYSSLSYLRSFPFDKIKIDRSFVKDISAADGSRAIVNAVIGLGKSLGMATTAEGIETEDQLELVRSQGCTEVQGFLFSPPLPASAIDALFAGPATTEWAKRVKKSG